jgi:hypothetical protein
MAGRDHCPTGTRFRLFPQLPHGRPGRPPETVWISTPPHRIGPGPSDDLVYLIHPLEKFRPYGVQQGLGGRPQLDLPPWRGHILRPVQPDPDGHFDHIPPGTPEFAEAHVFGSVRFTMDIWERYFGHPLSWHFGRDYSRLETVMLPSFNNAHVGYGFMEVGAHHGEDGSTVPFALNFDVIAHELGHLIIYGTVGIPRPGAGKGEYFGFHESAADMVAILAALHFDTMLDDLLDETRGNLYAFNELNRFAELSATEEIRLASNPVKMWEFSAGWDKEHDLSQPLTGALFDVLVDVFQEILVDRGLIPRELADLSDMLEQHPEYDALIQPRFDALYPARREAFREALIDAREYMGIALAATWQRLPADFLDFVMVAEMLIAVDRELTGGRHREEMVESFRWRAIGTVEAGPRLRPPDETSHAFSSRTVVPEMLAPAARAVRELPPLAANR